MSCGKASLASCKRTECRGDKHKNCITQGGICYCYFAKKPCCKFLLNIYVHTHGPALFSAAVSEQMLAWYNAENEPWVLSAKGNIYSITPTWQVQGSWRKRRQTGEGRSPGKHCLLQLRATGEGELLFFENVATRRTSHDHSGNTNWT